MGQREAQTPTGWLGKVWHVSKCTTRPGHWEGDLFTAALVRQEKMDQQLSMAVLWLGFLIQKPNTACACVCVIGNHSERGQWYKRACPFDVWPYKWFAMSLDHFYTLQASVLRPQELTVEIAWLICWRFSWSLFLDHLCVVESLPQFSYESVGISYSIMLYKSSYFLSKLWQWAYQSAVSCLGSKW